MCGLFGLSRASHSSIADSRRFVIAGLLAIETRGYDSTGLAWTQGSQKVVWYDKRVGRASKVARHLDIAGRAPIHSAIGHTRWSTQGAHTYDNSHPVIAENIVLAHNGCVDDDDLIGLTAVPRVGEVDSWAIAGVLQNAAKITDGHPSEVLDLVDGDAAVAWYDSLDPKTIHLARTVGRPMTLGWTKRGDMVMSSTRETLSMTARLAEVSVGDFIDVPEHTYLSVKQGSIIEWRVIGNTAAQARLVPPRGHSRKVKASDYLTSDEWWEESCRLLGDEWTAEQDRPF